MRMPMSHGSILGLMSLLPGRPTAVGTETVSASGRQSAAASGSSDPRFGAAA